MSVEVDEGSHWRIYAVYNDAYEFDSGVLPNGTTLGIPGTAPSDYLPGVTTDGKTGWTRHDDLTYEADVDLTASGVWQDPLAVYAADGVTKIGVSDLNGSAVAGKG